jgi:predicted phage tail protein
MLNVVLYGFLADKYGKYHSINAKSPAEVIRAFCANFKEFKQDIIQDGQAFYKILAGAENRSDANGLNVGTSKTIKLIPIVAGKGGLGKIIIGAALIAASIYFPGTSGALSGFLSSAASSIGFSLVLGGISSLLFAPSKTKSNSGERPENVPNYAFAGAVNVTGQGNPVPLCYGRMRVGSQVVSTGLSVGQL